MKYATEKINKSLPIITLRRINSLPLVENPREGRPTGVDCTTFRAAESCFWGTFRVAGGVGEGEDDRWILRIMIHSS